MRHNDRLIVKNKIVAKKANTVNKKHVLIGLLLPLISTVLGLLYLSFVYPFTSETFTLAPDEETTRELNLESGEHVYIWLKTRGWVSGRYAMDWVIKFYVTDPNNHQILYEPGIAGKGLLNPMSFAAQESGTYTMHFENTVGGKFEKTVDLTYKKAPAVLGIPIELLLLLTAAVLGALAITTAVLILIEKGNALKEKTVR